MYIQIDASKFVHNMCTLSFATLQFLGPFRPMPAMPNFDKLYLLDGRNIACQGAKPG